MSSTNENLPLPIEQPSLIVRAITVIGIALSLFQLYAAGVQPLGLFFQLPIHLGFVLVLCFLIYPAFGRHKPRGGVGWIIDSALIIASIAAGAWVPLNIEVIANQVFPRNVDVFMGIVTMIVVLEAARRAVGLGMTLIGAVFIVYAFAGNRGELPFLADFMPGILNHRGYSLERLASQMTLGAEGIFGIPLGVAATFVFVFVLFGAFLEVTGAGKFFIDLAYAAAGKKPGGPAKAAVIASAGMGSISGSAIANVVTTGAFTIPLMKKLGYRPAQAGGIEAAASTGGQIMPPLMGAGAFLMSEFTQVPYVQIVLVSIFPALLYFGSVYLLVHIAAVKQGMKGLPAEDLPNTRKILAEGWHFLLPLVALVALLVAGYSPMRVGFYAILSILAAASDRLPPARVIARKTALRSAPCRPTEASPVRSRNGLLSNRPSRAIPKECRAARLAPTTISSQSTAKRCATVVSSPVIKIRWPLNSARNKSVSSWIDRRVTIAAINWFRLSVWSARADDTSSAATNVPSGPKTGASIQLMAVLCAMKCSSRWMISARRSARPVPIPFEPCAASLQSRPGSTPHSRKAARSPMRVRPDSTTPFLSVKNTAAPQWAIIPNNSSNRGSAMCSRRPAASFCCKRVCASIAGGAFLCEGSSP